MAGFCARLCTNAKDSLNTGAALTDESCPMAAAPAM